MPVNRLQPQSTGLLSLSPLLVMHLGFWLIYFIADVFDHLKNGYYDAFPSLFCSVSACVITGLTVLLAKQFEHSHISKQGSIFIACVLVGAMFWHKIFEVLHRQSDNNISEELDMWLSRPWYEWLSTGYMPLFLFIAWAGMFAASKWYLENRQQQHRLNAALLESKEAQLQALRYQLNPHFLFNVLNSVDVSVVKGDNQVAHTMLQGLSDFLRSSLSSGEQSKIKLKEELKMIANYLAIEKVRFGDALDIQTTVPTEIDNCLIPPMILQPLMENAVKFAWQTGQKGIVRLSAENKSGLLHISIRNSKPETPPDRKGTGKGLANTQNRLKLLYAEDASLHTEETDTEFCVLLVLPVEQMI